MKVIRLRGIEWIVRLGVRRRSLIQNRLLPRANFFHLDVGGYRHHGHRTQFLLLLLSHPLVVVRVEQAGLRTTLVAQFQFGIEHLNLTLAALLLLLRSLIYSLPFDSYVIKLGRAVYDFSDRILDSIGIDLLDLLLDQF